MANTKLQIKRTTVSGRTPNTTNSGNTSYIDAGELAINLTDRKLFSSNGSAYFEVGANLSNLTVTSITANGTLGTNGQVLVSNGTTVYWANGGTGGGTTVTAGDYLYFDGDELNVNATSTSTASVVVARDANQNFAANVVSVNNLTVGGSQYVYKAVTTSNTDLQTFDSFATATYRSAHYMVQMTSGTDYHTIQLSLIHDGTNVYLAQYGEIFDNVSLGTFGANIASGNVNVEITPANSVTAIKAAVTLIIV